MGWTGRKNQFNHTTKDEIEFLRDERVEQGELTSRSIGDVETLLGVREFRSGELRTHGLDEDLALSERSGMPGLWDGP